MPFEGGLNPVGEGSVLVVDDDDAVFANRGANIASGTFQQVDAAGNLRDFDLNLAEVLVLAEAKARRKTREYCNTRPGAHGSHP